MKIVAHSPQLWDLLDRGAEIETLASGFSFCEGPVWHPGGYLLFADIPPNAIRRWDTEGVSVWRQPSQRANGLTLDSGLRLHACEHITSRVTRTELDGSITVVASHWRGKELNSPNDVIVASDGAVYFTDPDSGRTAEWGLERERELDFTGVYRVPPGGGDTVLLADDFELPNGLCLSPDESRLYVNDSLRWHIRVFDLRPDGTVAGDRVFIEQPGTGSFADGTPDGMKVDEHGNVWATGPHGVWVVSPEAEVLGLVEVDEQASNLAWGGPGWSELYVTTATTVRRIRTRTRGNPLPYMR